jgi:hypothetical protein
LLLTVLLLGNIVSILSIRDLHIISITIILANWFSRSLLLKSLILRIQWELLWLWFLLWQVIVICVTRRIKVHSIFVTILARWTYMVLGLRLKAKSWRLNNILTSLISILIINYARFWLLFLNLMIVNFLIWWKRRRRFARENDLLCILLWLTLFILSFLRINFLILLLNIKEHIRGRLIAYNRELCYVALDLGLNTKLVWNEVWVFSKHLLRWGRWNLRGLLL